ncbi:somatostatin receptor type 5 [Biomphalaria pfeifferi]|uniref:Somatostatin receptor type 5 n=1 Tax=Biomphalaria pfeifferi TaxID=112525 RepID=A0AAD8FFE0_BIOPF|nr:somatostatin receptor type 5 [Biomphalaria pfeifferi]
MTTRANSSDTLVQLSQDFLSEDVMAKIESALNCVLINMFALLGLIGTSINLLVLCQYNITTDTSNILLVSLSVADLLFCLTVPISMSMVGVISTERFLAVFFPFKTSRLMTPFRMKLLSVLVYVVNALMFSPTYFILTHDYVYSEKYQGLVPVIEPTEFFQKNFDAINIEIGIVYNIAVSGTSFLVTLVFTPAIAIKLWLVSRERTKLTNRKGISENHVAKLLLTVCAMSIVFYGPFIGFNAAITFLPQYSSLTNVFQVFLNVADFSGTVCAFSNFLIYVTMSRKFRNKYKELVLKLCILRNNNNIFKRELQRTDRS